MMIMITEACYDQMLQQPCPADPPPNEMERGLTGGAWFIVLSVVAIVLLFIIGYITAVRRENRIMRQGGDPMIHIGNMSIRPSSVKFFAILGVATHWMHNHKSIVARPDWQDKANQETREMWGRGPQP